MGTQSCSSLNERRPKEERILFEKKVLYKLSCHPNIRETYDSVKSTLLLPPILVEEFVTNYKDTSLIQALLVTVTVLGNRKMSL